MKKLHVLLTGLALAAVVAVVAVPLQHPTERLRPGPEACAAAVVLKSRQNAASAGLQLDLDRHVADQPGTVNADLEPPGHPTLYRRQLDAAYLDPVSAVTVSQEVHGGLRNLGCPTPRKGGVRRSRCR